MNAALRKALAAAQLTETDVAAHLGVDPKTVRRWLSGQRPYPRHRWALANLLQGDESDLWPQDSRAGGVKIPTSEFVQRVYTHRWQVPRDVWWELFSSAEQEIGILVYSGLFIADDTGMVDLLAERARAGVSVRILLGDPGSQSVKQRGEDENITGALSARASNALILLSGLSKCDKVDIRIHSTVLYNSVFMTEKRIIVNQHVYGLPASRSPVIELDRELSQEMADVYSISFEAVWSQSKNISQA